MSSHTLRAAAASLVLAAAAVLAPSAASAAYPALQTRALPELRAGSAILDIAAPEQNQIWIVGYQALKPGYPGNPVVHRWNGARWAGYTIPGFSSRGVLSSVNATPGGEVWIGGTRNGAAYIAHLVNGAFVQVEAPPGLTSAAPEFTASGLWVPGNRVEPPGASTIWRREGQAWVAHAMPMKKVLAVKGIGAEAWAVGNALPEDDFVPGVAHFTGTAWQDVPYPAPFSEGSTLEDVLPRTPDDIWVVGSDYTRGEPRPTEPLLSRYNGSTWSTVPLPPEIISLQSIAQDSAGKIWISGLALSPEEGSRQRAVVIGRSPDSPTWTTLETPAAGEFAVHHEGRDNLGIELTTSRLWLLSDTYPAGPVLSTASLLP